LSIHSLTGRSISNENLRAQAGAAAQGKGGLLSLLQDQQSGDGEEFGSFDKTR
jgi:hypothetical protein